MQNILPGITGLTVDGVIYQYTAVKNERDPMTVTIQNKNAQGSGYVFRSQDDWTGLRGNRIVKLVPVDNIPGNRWGDGEIAIGGKGSVADTSVSYKYRYDTCVDPLSSPICPGYAEAMLKSLSLKETEFYDPLTDEIRRNATENKAVCLPGQSLCITAIENRQESERSRKDNDVRKQSTNSLLGLKDIQLATQFEKLNDIPNFKLYSVSMPGGVYKDVLQYPNKILPDNRRARSIGIAQERLHDAMVNSQYDR
jgi:hypothetical protein